MKKILLWMMCASMAFAKIPSSYLINETNETEYHQMYSDPSVISIREVTNYLGLNSSKVKVELKYRVGSTPPMTIYYSKVKKGITHAGTLNLESIRFMKDATYALYVGNIYPVE